MNKDVRGSLKANRIFWFLLAIPIIVICDSRGLVFSWDLTTIELYLAFTSLDLAYFYFSANHFLPYTFKVYSTKVWQAFYILIVLLGYVIVLLSINTFLHYLIDKEFHFKINKDDFWASFSRGLLILSYAFILFHVRYRFQKEKELTEERIKKVEAEKKALELELKTMELEKIKLELDNKLLKANLNPHFINNTLTSLYMDVMERAPDLAEGHLLLLKISSYSLSKTDEMGQVSLKDDIMAIDNYVKIYRWLDRNGDLEFVYESVLDDAEGVYIAPLLMLDMVGNMFKYGNLRDPEHPGKIQISFTDKKLTFYSWNLKFETDKTINGHGIGLESMTKRLQNHYADRYELIINQDENQFEITFKLDLKL